MGIQNKWGAICPPHGISSAGIRIRRVAGAAPPPAGSWYPGKKIAAGVPPPAAKIIKSGGPEPDNMLFTLT